MRCASREPAMKDSHIHLQSDKKYWQVAGSLCPPREVVRENPNQSINVFMVDSVRKRSVDWSCHHWEMGGLYASGGSEVGQSEKLTFFVRRKMGWRKSHARPFQVFAPLEVCRFASCWGDLVSDLINAELSGGLFVCAEGLKKKSGRQPFYGRSFFLPAHRPRPLTTPLRIVDYDLQLGEMS